MRSLPEPRVPSPEPRYALAMKLGYEEFDLSGVQRVSAGVAAEQGAAGAVRRGARSGRQRGRVRVAPAEAPGRRRLRDGGRGDGRGACRRQADRLGFGAHVIKAGLSPVLIDLMERGLVSAMALNGAGVIHDVEIALAGATSEDVDAALGPGRFGMAEETATGINDAVSRGWAAERVWRSRSRPGWPPNARRTPT